MSRTDKSEHLSGSCEKTAPPYSLLLIQKFTPGRIYIRTQFFLHRCNNIRFTVENVACHGQTKCQSRVEGDVSQSPNSLKVNRIAKKALYGHMNEWIVLLP